MNKLKDLLENLSGKNYTDIDLNNYKHLSKYTTYYDIRKRNMLDDYCEKYGSDKGYVRYFGTHPYPWNPHNYTDFYIELFGHSRQYIQNVFECGLGTNNTDYKSNMTTSGKPGASLRVWRDFFYNANIVGVDIDPGCLFTEHRIETHQMDQTNPVQTYELLERLGYRYDIMIDDGLHEFHAGYTLFNVAQRYLTDNGVYIIEDVKSHDLDTYVKAFKDTNYFVKFVKLERDDEQVYDNNLIVIRKI